MPAGAAGFTRGSMILMATYPNGELEKKPGGISESTGLFYTDHGIKRIRAD